MTEAPSASHRVIDSRWLLPARLIKATVILSVVILAALLAAILHPDSMAQNQESFGEFAIQFGMPLQTFVAVIVVAAWLPLPFAFWHLFRIVFRGASEGEPMGKFGLVRAVFMVPSRHPDLRLSRLIVVLILGGYIVAMFTFAYMADERDLKRKRSETEDEQRAKNAMVGIK